MHRLRICGILSLGLRKHTHAMRAKKEPPGIRAVQTGGIQNGRTIEAAEHRQGCGSAADSGGNRNPGSSAGDWCQSRVAENTGDRSIRLHPPSNGSGGYDSRCQENRASGCGEGRPESVLSGTQAIKNRSAKNESRPKAVPICTPTYPVYHICASMSILSFSNFFHSFLCIIPSCKTGNPALL